MHPMTLVPLYYRRMFKGDRFDFGIIESILRSEPTFAPLLSNWRLQFEWYFDSDANRYGWMDNNNRLTSEQVMNRKHHTADYSGILTYNNGMVYDRFIGVGRGSLLDFAGVAPGAGKFVNPNAGGGSSARENFDGVFNVDFHLTYLNIIRNYHVNRQFPNVPYIHKPLVGADEDWSYQYMSLEDMDNLFMFLRSCPNGIQFKNLEDNEQLSELTDAPSDLESYYGNAIRAFHYYLGSTINQHGGIFCAEYEPDLYQNLLSEDIGLLRSSVSVVPLDDGTNGITIEQFRLKNHLQGLYDKIFVSGGTDRDLSRTIWGIESKREYDIPELICVHSEIIGTNLVTSSTAGEADYGGSNVNNVPGSMAGNINSRRGKGRMQRFTANTSGSLMCIVSLVPLLTYNENIERHMLTHNFMDEFTPDMARKGFETVPLSDYCALPRMTSENKLAYNITSNYNLTVGRQVAWLREMTAVNRCHGEFSNGGENYDWLLHRTFYYRTAQGGKQAVFTPYGRPTEFQYPFVSTALHSPNFNLQVAIKCDAYRPIPRKFMPNLGY